MYILQSNSSAKIKWNRDGNKIILPSYFKSKHQPSSEKIKDKEVRDMEIFSPKSQRRADQSIFWKEVDIQILN